MINHQILLVEDDALDVTLIKRAIRSVSPEIEIVHAADGESALAMLSNGPAPRLIVTDLKMPRMNGHQLLKTLKANSDLKRIPVIVFSTSDDINDVRSCYEEYANAYMIKPQSASAYRKVADTIRQHWFEIAAVPA